MDHSGDMARYIQMGLRAIGYPGLSGWDPDDPESPALDAARRHNEFVYDAERDAIVIDWMWGKDWGFKVTIEPSPRLTAQYKDEV